MKDSCPGLDIGSYDAVRVIKTKNFTFVKLADGSVHVTGRNGVNFTFGWGANDKDRSAFCKLSGIRLVDLRKQMAAQRKANASKQREGDLRTMRRLATRFGYKVTRRKNANPGAAKPRASNGRRARQRIGGRNDHHHDRTACAPEALRLFHP